MVDLTTARAAALERILAFGSAQDDCCTDDDLSSLYADELDAPWLIRTEGVARERPSDPPDPPRGPRPSQLAWSEDLSVGSLRELLSMDQPPLALLQLAKGHAKRLNTGRRRAVPDEVSRALYVTVIAAALARTGVLITQLDEDQLRRSFAWAVAQPWIDDQSRRLLIDAGRSLRAS